MRKIAGTAFCLGISMMLHGCATGGATGGVRFNNQEVLGGSFVVCTSQVKYQGYNLVVEGIEVGSKMANKPFSIAKASFKPEQIRQVDNITLTIDSYFKQMCQNTILLHDDKQALADYIKSRDPAVKEIFAAIAQMVAINKKESNPDKVVAEQQKVFDKVQSTLP